MRTIINLIFFCGLTLPLLAQKSPAQVFLSLRSGYTQSTPNDISLNGEADWGFSYGTDVTFELNKNKRLRPAFGIGLGITNVNTQVEHGFILNEGFAEEMVELGKVNPQTRLVSLSVPLQLSWYPGKGRETNTFFVFIRSEFLVAIGAGNTQVTIPDDAPLTRDRRLQGMPVEQAGIAHLLGGGVGWNRPFGDRGRILRLQPYFSFSTLSLINDPGVSTDAGRLAYFRATDIIEFGLSASIGF